MKTCFYKTFIFSTIIYTLNCACCNLLYGQTGIPFIYNYSPKEYSAKNDEYNSGTQNWTIVQDKRGVMYFGNNDGVLIYDGNRWRMVETSNGTTVRSMEIDNKGRIFVGALGEFGHLSVDSTGKMIYVSLVNKIPEEHRLFKDVWAIHALKEAVYFRSYNAIYKWENDTVTVLSAGEGRFRSSFVVNDGFYIFEKTEGLLQLTDDDKLLPVLNGELFQKAKIYSMLPYSNNRVLIGTKDIGFLVYDGIEFKPLPTDIDKFIDDKRIYNGIRLNNGNYAIGTLSGGLAIINEQGKLYGVFDKTTGLQDEIITYSYVDMEGGLWLGLNNGIARMEFPSPLTSISDQQGLEGKVMTVLRHDGILYTGTSNGLFMHKDTLMNNFGKEQNIKDQLLHFKRVGNINSQTRHLMGYKNTLLVAVPSTGVFELKNNKLKQILPDPSFFIFKIDNKKTVGFVDDLPRALVGMQSGLAVIVFKNETWEFEKKIEGIEEQVWSIVDDNDGNLWLGTLYQGVLKVNFQNGINKPVIEKFSAEQNLPSGWVEVYSILGQQYFATDQGLFKYESSSKKFYKDSTFFNKQTSNKNIEIYCLAQDKNNNVWVRCDKEIRVAVPQYSNGVVDSFLISRVPFLRIPKSKANVIYPDDNDITWIAGPDGLIRYDVKIKKDYNVKFNALIRKVSLGKDSVIFYGDFFSDNGYISMKQTDVLFSKLPYKFNSITFEFAAPGFDNDKANRFQYFLEGFDSKWSEWTKETKKEYTNLPEGTFNFRVRAINVYEQISNESAYSFEIYPPWYRTKLTYITYFLLFIGIIYGAIRYNVRRLEQQNKKLQEMVDKATVEIRKQKDEIVEKNKDILASIRYAQKIQKTILPDPEVIQNSLPNSFVLYRPKDIVSGDFYWFSNKIKNKILISAVDCTGHGVPGAFMSVIGNTLLNEIVNGKGIDQPAEILNNLHIGVRQSLKQDEHQEAGSTRDGMDLALCCINIPKNSGDKINVQYAGAYRPLFHLRGEELEEIKPDKMPIGGEQLEEKRIFTNKVIDIIPGDSIYMFSDGFVDQFGGPKGKKFMTARFKKILVDIRSHSMKEQQEILTKHIEEWMKNYEQIDDICVIGIRF